MIKRKAPLSLLVILDSISKNTLEFFSVSQSRQCRQIIGRDKVILRHLNSLLLILFNIYPLVHYSIPLVYPIIH